jgi:hypothetical protein
MTSNRYNLELNFNTDLVILIHVVNVVTSFHEVGQTFKYGSRSTLI